MAPSAQLVDHIFHISTSQFKLASPLVKHRRIMFELQKQRVEIQGGNLLNEAALMRRSSIYGLTGLVFKVKSQSHTLSVAIHNLPVLKWEENFLTLVNSQLAAGVCVVIACRDEVHKNNRAQTLFDITIAIGDIRVQQVVLMSEEVRTEFRW